MQVTLPRREVVLWGVGHTNAHVLRMWRMEPIRDARLTCVSDHPIVTYSGMLPGVLAGQYPQERMEIDLVRLCAAAGARLLVARVTGVDVERRELLFDDRPAVPFDVLSIGIGSVPRRDEARQGGAALVPIKPMQTFLVRLEARLDELRARFQTDIREGDRRDASFQFSVFSFQSEGAEGTAESAGDKGASVAGEGDRHPLPPTPAEKRTGVVGKVSQSPVSLTSSGLKRPLRAVVVGGGVGGVEITFCLPARLRKVLPDVPLELTLVDAAGEVAHGTRPRTQALARRTLEERGVRRVLGKRVVEVTDEGLALEDGSRLEADLVLWATSATSPPALASVPLPLDDDGFLLTRPTLQTVADAPIFAVGDTGTISHNRTPKAGVYAVRQGPVLWENIGRMLAGEPLVEYVPQRGFLKLLNTGDGSAIGEYKGFSTRGRWCWRLKDGIDGRFMDKYQSYRPMEAMQYVGENGQAASAMRCAGCGGKVEGAVLSRVLARLVIPPSEHVLLGLDRPDDAAVIRPPDGRPVTLTTDFFAAPLDDAYTVGRIAALNAVSDVFAMGGKPIGALAMATIPPGSARRQEEYLYELLAGGLREFRAMGATLVGGHTIEGPQLTIGYTIVADQGSEAPLTKGRLKAGDVLVLTKPLGSGVLLAAHMRAMCRAAWMQPLLDCMLGSNQRAAEAAAELGVMAITDITGFGLAGHMLEMLRASDLAAELDLAQVPLLPGAAELIGQGVESTLAPGNRDIENEIHTTVPPSEAAYQALFDPQTSGGLLIGIAPTNAEKMLARLAEASDLPAAIIGRVLEHESGGPRIRVK